MLIKEQILLYHECKNKWKGKKLVPYKNYHKLWRSEFYNIVSAKNRVQGKNHNQLKLKVNNTYKTDEKLTTKFGDVNDEDVINKGYLDWKIAELKCQIWHIEKIYIEFKDLEKSNEEVLIERAVKTTIQILYGKRILDNYDNANELLKNCLLIEVNKRRRPDLDPIYDVVFQWFCPKVQFKKQNNVEHKNSTNPFISVSHWCRNLFRRWTIHNWCTDC